MFATLLGPLPRPPLPDDAAPEALLEAVIALQVEHGLEPLTSAGRDAGPDPGDPVGSWRAAAARTDRLVKAVVDGPISGGAGLEPVRRTLLGLAAAGCTWIEVHEAVPGLAVGPGDPVAQGRFADTHRTLTSGLDGVHLSLALIGGSAEALGIDALLAGTYASLAVDLIEGPDNWRLVAAAPGDRGIIVGALDTSADSGDGPELLLWAAGYAASTAGRGGTRVGLATAGSLAHLPWDVAARKVARLGAAARLADSMPGQIREAVDPRAIDIRSAALGRYRRARRS